MNKFITHQNIEIQLELAGLGERIIAFLVDAFITGTYALTVFFFYSLLSGFAYSRILLIFLLPVFFYSLLFEVFSNGQTPGKKYRNIKVVKLDGGNPELGAYLLRWVIRPIDFFLYGCFAILSIIVTQHGQRLGDLAAGTTVIRQGSAVSLSDVGRLTKDKGHQVTYPQVKRLSDKQVQLIRHSLYMRRDGLNAEAADEVAQKTKEFLNIQDDRKAIAFLYTVLKDYECLHSA